VLEFLHSACTDKKEIAWNRRDFWGMSLVIQSVNEALKHERDRAAIENQKGGREA
jgi:hypothetical protein